MKRQTTRQLIEEILSPLAAVVDKLNRRREVVKAELDQIDEHLERFGDRSNGRRSAFTPLIKKAGKRKRRSREEVEAQAAGVVDFIKAAGREGISGKEITTRFGNLLPSVNAWLQNYSKTKVKTSGEKSRMRYFA